MKPLAAFARLIRRATGIQQMLDELRSLHRTVGADLDLIRRGLAHLAHDIPLAGKTHHDPRSLVPFRGQVYSQNAEDGAIAEIFRRISTQDRVFVEIGVGDGSENNTRFLLELGWRGYWVEGDRSNTDEIRARFGAHLASGQLTLLPSFVTKENIDDLLRSAGVPETFDLLSLDIDVNTLHVWDAMAAFRPRVACLEYNSAYPPSVDFRVPYGATSVWDGSNRFGASLKAFEVVGRDKGYSLVGCEFLGVNCFFVRSDLCAEAVFLSPFTAEFHYEPPRFVFVGTRGHRRSSQ